MDKQQQQLFINNALYSLKCQKKPTELILYDLQL